MILYRFGIARRIFEALVHLCNNLVAFLLVCQMHDGRCMMDMVSLLVFLRLVLFALDIFHQFLHQSLIADGGTLTRLAVAPLTTKVTFSYINTLLYMNNNQTPQVYALKNDKICFHVPKTAKYAFFF